MLVNRRRLPQVFPANNCLAVDFEFIERWIYDWIQRSQVAPNCQQSTLRLFFEAEPAFARSIRDRRIQSRRAQPGLNPDRPGSTGFPLNTAKYAVRKLVP
jgi:hypothetical protein